MPHCCSGLSAWVRLHWKMLEVQPSLKRQWFLLQFEVLPHRHSPRLPSAEPMQPPVWSGPKHS